MKTKQIILTVLITFSLLSCKKDEKKEQEINPKQIEKKVINPNTLKIELDLVIENDDELILFWKDKYISFFDAKNTIYVGVKGSSKPQTVFFEFEEGLEPNDIRLDISSKTEQKPIRLISIKITQQDRIFFMDKNNFEMYFLENAFVSYEVNSGIISFKDKDGMHDPFFTTKPAFFPEFEKVQNTIF